MRTENARGIKMKINFIFALLITGFICASLSVAGGKTKQPRSPLDFHMLSIDGEDVDLAQYKGKVALFVNVASKCGNTP